MHHNHNSQDCSFLTLNVTCHYAQTRTYSHCNLRKLTRIISLDYKRKTQENRQLFLHCLCHVVSTTNKWYLIFKVILKGSTRASVKFIIMARAPCRTSDGYPYRYINMQTRDSFQGFLTKMDKAGRRNNTRFYSIKAGNNLESTFYLFTKQAPHQNSLPVALKERDGYRGCRTAASNSYEKTPWRDWRIQETAWIPLWISLAMRSSRRSKARPSLWRSWYDIIWICIVQKCSLINRIVRGLGAHRVRNLPEFRQDK